MSPLTSSIPLLPEAGNLFPLGIYQLHGVIHQVIRKYVKVYVSGGVNNTEKGIDWTVVLGMIINL